MRNSPKNRLPPGLRTGWLWRRKIVNKRGRSHSRLINAVSQHREMTNDPEFRKRGWQPCERAANGTCSGQTPPPPKRNTARMRCQTPLNILNRIELREYTLCDKSRDQNVGKQRLY